MAIVRELKIYVTGTQVLYPGPREFGSLEVENGTEVSRGAPHVKQELAWPQVDSMNWKIIKCCLVLMQPAGWDIPQLNCPFCEILTN